jgi:hypothetical protein
VRLWDGILWQDPGDLRAAVCTLVWQNLTRRDWERFAPDLPYRAPCSG